METSATGKFSLELIEKRIGGGSSLLLFLVKLKI